MSGDMVGPNREGELASEKNPAVAALEDFRPGAEVLLRYCGAETPREELVEVASYPFEHTVYSLKGIFVQIKRAKAIESLPLESVGVVPYNIPEGASGKYSVENQAILQKPAPIKSEERLLPESLKQALRKPLNELDADQARLVRHYFFYCMHVQKLQGGPEFSQAGLENMLRDIFR